MEKTPSSYNFGRELGRNWKLVTGLIVLVALALGLYGWLKPKEIKLAPYTAAPAAVRPAQPSKGDIEINIVLAGAQRLKDSMKKPETFQLISAGMIDGKVICYEYKARNSFNDQALGRYVVTDTVSSSKASDWNAHCGGKQPTDYTSVRSVLR